MPKIELIQGDCLERMKGEDIMRNIILSKWEKFNYWGAKIFLGGSMLDVVDDMVTWVDKIFLDERKRTN